MSIRQDRLTFFGVLLAVVIAVLGYLQLGNLYPVEGRASTPAETRGGADEKDLSEGGASAVRREDASPTR